MSFNTDYSKKMDLGVNAGSIAGTSSCAKNEEKPNTVFENNETSNKKKLKLNKKELNYLISNGYDVNKMSDKDIQTALEPLYADTSGEANKTSDETTAKEPGAETANTTNTESQTTAQTSNTTAEPKKDAASSQNAAAQPAASSTAKPRAQTQTEAEKNTSTTEVKINYNDEDLKLMGFTPDETGVDACDYYSKLSIEEQENFLVTAFAKKQFGENWLNMSAEAKAEALQAIEAQLAEAVPSWKDLTQEEKIALGHAFMTGSESQSKYLYDGDANKNSGEISKLPLNEQIQHAAKNIMAETSQKVKNATETLSAKFNQEIENSYKGKKEDVYDYQLDYLENKIKKSGKESFNEFELKRYELLKDAKTANGGRPLRYVFGEIKVDKENSTFAKMEKDEHYKEIKNKRYGEIYNKIENKDEAEKQAEADAKTDWFIHQFEDIDPADKKALVKKYFELRDNCSSLEEMAELQKLALKVEGLGITDNKDAVMHYHNIKHSHNADEQVKGTQAIAEASKNGKIDEEIVAGIAKDIPDSYKQEAVTGSTIALTRVSKKAAVAVVNNTKDGKYTVEQQEAIFTDPIKNPDMQIDKESTNVLAEAIGHTDASIQIDLNEKYTEFAVENKDTDLMKSIAIGVPEYSKENQTTAFKNILQGSEKFDDIDAIDIQKTLSNQIAKSDKSNQLEMHGDIMKSKYSEVQEQAARNIKNYDPSVQIEAIDKVYESKNTKAVQAVLDSLDKMPPQVQKSEAVRLIGEIALNGAVESGLLETRIMSGSLSARELMQLTPKQRREYFVKQFEEASPTKKLEILKKLASVSSGVYKKTIYTIIARFSSPLLKSMVESGLGKTMLDTGLPIDAVNKIINVMKTSTNNDVIEQLKELKLDSSFEKYFDDKEEADAGKKSITIPPEFGNDVKKIFAKKGMKANALMDIKS